jgi:hypothetical protein
MAEGGVTGRGFKKGQSGNPGGRAKGIAEMQELARTHTPAAIEALVVSLANAQTRVHAAVALLDRGWGKPAQAITGADGGKLKVLIEVITGVPRADEDDDDGS